MKPFLILFNTFLIVLNTYSQKIEFGNPFLKIAKHKSDSSLVAILGNKIYSENLVWNINNSFVNCKTKSDIKLFTFADTFPYTPRLYYLDYYLILKGDTLLRFDMQSDSASNFNLTKDSYWYYTLLAYKKLLTGKFKISQQEAIAIAVKNGIKGEALETKLNYDANNTYSNRKSKYYWNVTIKNCKNCKSIHVNPLTGEVLGVYDSILININ